MKKKMVGLLVIAALAMSLAAGCGSSGMEVQESTGSASEASESVGESSAEAESTDEEAAAIKDEMHIAIASAPPTLDTMMGTEYMPRVIAYGNVYEALVTLTEDFNWKPELAEEVVINENYTEYTYKLRQGVMFHNGEEMTADDVVASMNRWIEKYGNAGNMVGDSRFEKVDDYTVKIELEQPTLFLNELIATQSQGSVIMPASVIENADSSSGAVSEYIGTGPYKFEEWVDDQYIKLSRFEGYEPYAEKGERDGWWGYKSAPTETIYYDFVTDSATRTAGIQTGEYDVAYELPTENYELFTGNDDFKIFKEVSGAFVVVYNKKSGLTQDPLIRLAVNAVLNPEEVLLGAYSSEEFYRVETSYMGSEMTNWYSTEGADNAHLVDTEKAKSYLEEAGYDGTTFRILVPSENVFFCNAAVVVQQELESIGMSVEIVMADSSSYSSYRNDETKYDIFFSNALPVSVPTLQIFLSPSWAGFTSDQAIFDGCDAINSSTSIEEAKGKWDSLQKYCWEESLPVTKLGSVFNYTVTTDAVNDFEYFNGPVVVNTTVSE